MTEKSSNRSQSSRGGIKFQASDLSLSCKPGIWRRLERVCPTRSRALIGRHPDTDDPEFITSIAREDMAPKERWVCCLTGSKDAHYCCDDGAVGVIVNGFGLSVTQHT